MPKTTSSSCQWNYWKRLSVVPLAVGMLGLTLATVGLQPTNPVRAQEQQRLLRTVTVTGTGTERIPTTLTQVRLGVEVRGRTAREVQEEIARRSSAVVELLRSRQVDKLETTGIRLNPIYNNANNARRITGYAGTNIVSFRVETQRAGNILDAAVTAGATRIDGISFIATDNAIATAQKQALRLATQDAQQQADAVLGTLNLTGQEIVNIQINGAIAPPPVFKQNLRGVSQLADVATTPVVGGEQQVQASVTLQIRY